MSRSRSFGIGACANTWLEISIRIVCFIVYYKLEQVAPFERKIHKEEQWLYSNPRSESYVPSYVLWPIVFTAPATVFSIYFLISRNKLEFIQASLAVSLAIGLNGLLTNSLKLTVGRPRPDFIERCFPDGIINDDMKCTGNPLDVIEGRKSFPSGHSSFAFTSLCFIAWYLMGKLHVFGERGRGQAWPLCISITPIFAAIFIAVSRTCDYHHHWQDICVGSICGILISYLCYRLYYPSFSSNVSHRSYVELSVRNLNETAKEKEAAKLLTAQQPETDAFSPEEKETKWI